MRGIFPAYFHPRGGRDNHQGFSALTQNLAAPISKNVKCTEVTSNVRITSRKRADASRENGSKSGGPVSSAGKHCVRLNALRDGLFSQDIVIESAGERVADFEALKKHMWEFLNPMNPLEEMLVTDIVENYWRRRRVRRCETTELDNKFRAQETRDGLKRAERLETLRVEFSACFQTLLGTTAQGLCWDKRVREELASTSLGMDHLIDWMVGVEEQVTADGYLSKKSAEIMRACGIDIPTIVSCEMWSSYAEEEFEQIPQDGMSEESSANPSQVDTDQGTTENKKPKRYGRKSPASKMLMKAVREAIASLEERKKTLESIEQMEARTRSAAALLPADSIDRFSRAETTFERRMYRALGALLSLRGAAGSGMKLPEIPG